MSKKIKIFKGVLHQYFKSEISDEEFTEAYEDFLTFRDENKFYKDNQIAIDWMRRWDSIVLHRDIQEELVQSMKGYKPEPIDYVQDDTQGCCDDNIKSFKDESGIECIIPNGFYGQICISDFNNLSKLDSLFQYYTPSHVTTGPQCNSEDDIYKGTEVMLVADLGDGSSIVVDKEDTVGMFLNRSLKEI